MWFLLRPLRFFAKVLTDEDSPRKLALGVAMGMVIGLVPKGNLTAVALMIVFSATRVNLTAGLLSAFVFTWAAAWFDPLTHRLGHFLLTWEMLRPFWTQLYNLPIVPWTDFNNTVVLGSLIVGLISLVPMYKICRPVFERVVPIVRERVRRYRIAQLLWGAEWAGRFSG